MFLYFRFEDDGDYNKYANNSSEEDEDSDEESEDSDEEDEDTPRKRRKLGQLKSDVFNKMGSYLSLYFNSTTQ